MLTAITSLPLLSIIISLPLLAALFLKFFPSRFTKILAIAIAILELTLTLIIISLFDPVNPNFQLIERHTLLPIAHIDYLLGIDGLSVAFIPLTALLTVMILLVCPPTPRCYSLLLALESMVIGLYCALDAVLFFGFWMAVPSLMLCLLRTEQTAAEQQYSLLKYGVFMAASCLFILIAILMLAIGHVYAVDGKISQTLSFNLQTWLATPVADGLQPIILSLFIIGFAIAAPILPFHTWLPTLAAQSSSALGALLIGMKVGLFGLIRWALPLNPSAAVEFSWPLGIAGGLTLIYCALIALRQSRLNLILVYATISQTGGVIVGIASLTIQGLQGALLALVNFTLIGGGLMLMIGCQRVPSVNQEPLKNVQLAPLYMVFVLAALALPGTSGFAAELLLIIGTLMAHPGLGLTALLGVILKAVFMRSFADQVFLAGGIKGSARHLGLCLPLILILVFGCAPGSLLKLNQKSAEAWLSHLLEPPEIDFSKTESTFMHSALPLFCCGSAPAAFQATGA